MLSFCPPDPPEPPFWAAGIAVVVLLLVAVVITILVIIVVCRKRLHKKKALQRVEPSGEGSGEAVQLLKQDLPPGTPGSNEDELNFTHTSSLTVIIPKGGWRGGVGGKGGVGGGGGVGGRGGVGHQCVYEGGWVTGAVALPCPALPCLHSCTLPHRCQDQ